MRDAVEKFDLRFQALELNNEATTALRLPEDNIARLMFQGKFLEVHTKIAVVDSRIEDRRVDPVYDDSFRATYQWLDKAKDEIDLREKSGVINAAKDAIHIMNVHMLGKLK
jgi:hypothetical protein